MNLYAFEKVYNHYMGPVLEVNGNKVRVDRTWLFGDKGRFQTIDSKHLYFKEGLSKEEIILNENSIKAKVQETVDRNIKPWAMKDNG